MKLPNRKNNKFVYWFICLFVGFAYLLIPASVLAANPTDGTYTLMFNSYAGGGGNAIGAQISGADTNAYCTAGGTGQCKIPLSSMGEVMTPGSTGISSSDTNAVCEAGGSGVCRINAGYPSVRRSRFVSSGSFTSTNLLTGIPVVASISSFAYTLTALPANTTATVQFSQNGTSWYKSDGTLDGSDSLSVGGAAISLTALSWSGANFYYKVSFTSNGVNTPILTGITLTYSTNGPPVAPVFVTTPSSSCAFLAPQFVFSSTDGQSDYLQYKIQIATDTGFTANLQTFDETSSQIGWSGQNTQNSLAYASGANATFTAPSNLNPGVLYYARAYAIDPGGSNTWGNANTAAVSFTTAAPPSPPTLTYPANGATNVPLNPIMKMTTTNTCSVYQRYKLQIATDTAFSQNLQTFDSTLTASGWSNPDNPTAVGSYNSGTTATFTLATPLTEGTTYYWRVWSIAPSAMNTWSNPGQHQGSGVVYGTFSTTLGSTDRPVSCITKSNVTTGALTIAWTNTSTTANQIEIQKATDGQPSPTFVALTTVTPPTSSVTDTPTAGHTYQYRMRAKNTSTTVNSGWCTTSPVTL